MWGGGVREVSCLKGRMQDTKMCVLFQEEPDTRLAIQEALSMMVGAYTSLEGAPRTLMEALVASNLIKVCEKGRVRKN